MPTKFKQLLPAAPGFHLVIHDSEVDGTSLLPVVCWAVVSKDGEADELVVPMVVQPYTRASELCFYAPGDDDVVGISVPGDSEAMWHDTAAEIRKEDASAEDREERKVKTAGLAPTLSPEHHQALRHIEDKSRAAGVARAPEPSAADRLHLLETELAACGGRDHEGKARWHLTELGRSVLALLDEWKR